MKNTHPVDALAQKVDEDWSNIVQARKKSVNTIERINRALAVTDHGGAPLLSREVSVVAFGSLARAEFTNGSDLDWTMLIDGQADPGHLELKKAVERQLKKENSREPGAEGTFGEMVFSHDLVHQIGGDEDTNRNTTRRCLMLLESVPLGEFPDAYTSVTAAILERYLIEDPSFKNKKGPFSVPRFLLNDFTRYWRTMAVDFAYKRRKRFGKGAALRVIKLRFSRKMLFASGLLACFACQMNLAPSAASCSKNAAECIQCLGDFLKRPPQEIVAAYFLKFLNDNKAQQDRILATASKIFSNYNAFLGILENEQRRDHLDSLEPEDFETDSDFDEGRKLSRDFSEGMLELFFDLNEELYKMTRFYGVF